MVKEAAGRRGFDLGSGPGDERGPGAFPARQAATVSGSAAALVYFLLTWESISFAPA